MYSVGEFQGLKLTVFDHFGHFWVLIKDIPPYILVYFLPRFVLTSGGSKIRGKSAEMPIGGKEYSLCDQSIMHKTLYMKMAHHRVRNLLAKSMPECQGGQCFSLFLSQKKVRIILDTAFLHLT